MLIALYQCLLLDKRNPSDWNMQCFVHTAAVSCRVIWHLTGALKTVTCMWKHSNYVNTVLCVFLGGGECELWSSLCFMYIMHLLRKEK